MTKIIIVLLSFFIFTSCEKKCDCLKSTGTIITEERTVTPFNGISMRKNVDVIIHHGNEYRLQVSAGKNLIDKIETNIKNGILHINNFNTCNWVRKFNPQLKVEIWTPSLNTILVDEASGNITFVDTIPVDIFRLDSFSSLGKYALKLKGNNVTIAIHNGPADIDLSGISSNFYIYAAGYGKMNAEDFIVTNCYSTNKSTNDFTLNCSSILEADIEGIGNIYYKGSPTVTLRKATGTGKLIKIQ